MLKTLLIMVRNDKQYRRPTAGLCNGVREAWEAFDFENNPKLAKHFTPYFWFSDLMEATERWPLFSGVSGYPVPASLRGPPSSFDSFVEQDAYRHARDMRTIWSRRTAYGRARWALLNWLIDDYLRKVKPYRRKDLLP